MSEVPDINARLADELRDGTADIDKPAPVVAIPSPTTEPSALLRTVNALKQAVEILLGQRGSVLDKTMTLRDMLTTGTIVYSGGAVASGEPLYTTLPPSTAAGEYYTVPPTPTNLTVTMTFRTAFVEWDLITYQNHAYVEVWRHTSDVQGAATLKAQISGEIYIDDDVAYGTTYYYWVRAVNTSNTPGAFNAINGVQGTLYKVGNSDLGPLIVEAANLASGAITTAKFAAGIEPVSIVSSLPNPSGYTGPSTVFLTTDGKLYRYTGGAWTKAVDGADIIANSIVAGKIAAGAISTTELAANAVTAGKIAANAIVAGDGVIQNAAITNALIANLAVDSAKIVDLSVGTAKIADLAIGTAKIADLAITNAKIANLAVDNAKIADLAVNKLTGSAMQVGAYIQSTNYVAGAGGAGWRINADGTAELQAAYIRGQLVASQIDTRNLTIKDGAGNIVLQSGSAIDWSKLNGAAANQTGLGIKNYRVVAVGYSSTSHPTTGFWDTGSGTQLHSGGSMYTVLKINRATGVLSTVGTYNTLAGAPNPGNMAAALNAIGSDHIVIVFSYDEPRGNRLNDGLETAMYRCGASRQVFGSAWFRYRSAYVLIGIPGAGEGNGFEAYRGDIDYDTNAWCDVSFSVINGNIAGVSGATNIGKEVGADNMVPNVGTVSVPDGSYGTVLAYLKDNSVPWNPQVLIPGEQLTLSADLYCDAACAAAGQYAALFLWTEEVGGTWINSSAAINDGASTRQVDTRLSVTMRMPNTDAEMYRVRVGLYHQGTNAGTSPTGVIYAKRIQLERGGVATPYKLPPVNASNLIRSTNASTYIADAAIGTAQIGVLTAGNLTVTALSNTVNGGAGSGQARVVISTNAIEVYNASNALRVRISS